MNAIPMSPPSPTVQTPSRRTEPWPIALAIFFAGFIACIASFITFAVRQRMDLVRPDYYEDEIRYQVQMNRVDRTRALGSEAALSLDAARQNLKVRIPGSHAAALESGSIQLYRPSDARADRVWTLKPGTAGTQEVGLSDLGRGRWRARVRWKTGGLEYHLEEALVLGQ